VAQAGYQLTTFLYGLGGGRTRPLAAPAELQNRGAGNWTLGVQPGPVLIGGVCPAVQVDGTTCGSAAIALAMASDAGSRGIVENQDGAEPDAAAVAADFAALQREIKAQTNRKRWIFGWPQAWGTAPWGAARVMRFAGHEYYHRMVVDTSIPQATRVLTRAAECARAGYPVLLYTGGDTSRGWGTAVPRHVVVLHSPPADPAAPQISDDSGSDDLLGADRTGDAEIDAKLAGLANRLAATLKRAQGMDTGAPLYIYDPSRGHNTEVTLEDLISRRVDPDALGGWPHLTWAVLPKPLATKPQE